MELMLARNMQALEGILSADQIEAVRKQQEPQIRFLRSVLPTMELSR